MYLTQEIDIELFGYIILQIFREWDDDVQVSINDELIFLFFVFLLITGLNFFS